MKLESHAPVLSAVFVDYDNIYLSLKRKNEEAAKQFSKDASLWLKAIENGRLITPTNGPNSGEKRRMVMNRCYGNPVPRRNSQDNNATDMSSFPFVRHNFLRAGFEIVDCPPLTAQLKNSADIRMVMDVLDYLAHETRFNEFIILSGDADFTPLLHRLRAHARRTVVFANEYTATPFTAISDGEIREADLISLLVEGRLPGETGAIGAASPALSSGAQAEATRRQILAEVAAAVRAAGQPLPLETLADRAVRALGHEKTIGSSWGGAGTFRDLLTGGLAEPMRLSEQAPFIVYEAAPRQIEAGDGAQEARAPRAATQLANPLALEAQRQGGVAAFSQNAPSEAPRAAARNDAAPSVEPAAVPPAPQRASAPQRPSAPPRLSENATAIQKSITRIHEASKAPPLSPPDYRLLFGLMAKEIDDHGLNGAQTLLSILRRGQEDGVEFRRDDVRFVLEVVSEADPWFEQGASANLFAGRFRNFVVAQCRSQGLSLSAEELDLIEAWFAGPAAPARRAAPVAQPSRPAQPLSQELVPRAPPAPEGRSERWWNIEDARQITQSPREPAPFEGSSGADEEFPRIVRSRLRG